MIRRAFGIFVLSLEPDGLLLANFKPFSLPLRTKGVRSVSGAFLAVLTPFI